LGVGVHGEGGQTVDVGGSQPGVVQRVEHGLGRQPQFTAPGVLREVGCADADDGGFTGQHQLSPMVRVVVAMMWSPRLLEPTTFTVTRPSTTSVTSPVNVTVS